MRNSRLTVVAASWAPSYEPSSAYESGRGSYYFYFPIKSTKDTDDRG